jgi:hypothetical protein
MAPFLAESLGGLVLDDRSSRMELTDLEREFLRTLLGES